MIDHHKEGLAKMGNALQIERIRQERDLQDLISNDKSPPSPFGSPPAPLAFASTPESKQRHGAMLSPLVSHVAFSPSPLRASIPNTPASRRRSFSCGKDK